MLGRIIKQPFYLMGYCMLRVLFLAQDKFFKIKAKINFTFSQKDCIIRV